MTEQVPSADTNDPTSNTSVTSVRRDFLYYATAGAGTVAAGAAI